MGEKGNVRGPGLNTQIVSSEFAPTAFTYQAASWHPNRSFLGHPLSPPNDILQLSMHRLTVVALTLLVIIASILPPVLARETNADRLRRGYPPLPPSRREPTRRDTAKRSGTSSVPPKT